MKKNLILGSGSPRRRDLLEELGISYQVAVSGVDETSETVGINPEGLAEELALKKARAVAASRDSGVVLGADTESHLPTKRLLVCCRNFATEHTQ